VALEDLLPWQSRWEGRQNSNRDWRQGEGNKHLRYQFGFGLQ
jgi:hypothetical protein